MLFNSFQFAVFLPIIFLAYWLIPERFWKAQNILLIVASYFFYCSWEWRFGGLLLFSTLLDFYTGLKISNAETRRTKKVWLWISICINLGFLGFFKYYNFFISAFPQGANFAIQSIILPVGISFYTFHGLSYVIDIYYDRIKPEHNFVTYGLFVSFFPLLVAGPIERANHLLPQLKGPRTFTLSKGADGIRQILWGLFKKVVIADNCATYANLILGDPDHHYGSTLFLGAIFFAFQIYGDFSGYSDIALGTARLFGIELLRNFAFPYFSRDIAEFWRRWHISLSSWFKDYLYIPLGGSKVGKWKQVRNTFIIFIVSGFWHGANWTFIAWGVLNAIYFMPLLLLKQNRQHLTIASQNGIFPSLRDLIKMALTFIMVVFGWILFRAESVNQAIQIIRKILSRSAFHFPSFPGSRNSYVTIILIILMVGIEWLGRSEQYGIANIKALSSRPVRWAFYIFLISIMALFMQTNESPFIYFQF